MDAHLVSQALDREGIPNQIRNEMLSGLGGAIPIADASPQVWVFEADFEAAHGVVSTIEKSGEDRGKLSIPEAKGSDGSLSFSQSGELSQTAEKKCSNCGEENPADFGECWNCQNEFV